MKKILSILKRPFRVQYRLSVMYSGNNTGVGHEYSNDRKLIRRRAHNVEGNCEYWTLYKSGPFGLPEREIDRYTKGGSE